MKSILSNKQVCYVCGYPDHLHRHHIFSGYGRRSVSEKYGCWCYLCAIHHNASNEGVHFNPALNQRLRAKCQAILESQGWTRQKFIDTFGRNYIDAD